MVRRQDIGRMTVRLRITSTSHAGQELPLKRGTYLIGRSKECYLRARSDLVSRRHCELVVDTTSVIVRDLGSKNGTLVNGQRIDEPRVLESGDTLQIGPMRFEIQIESAADTVPGDQATSARHPETVADAVEAPDRVDATAVESVRSPKGPTSQPATDDDYDEDISDWLDDDPSELDEPATADTDGPAVAKTGAVDQSEPGTTPTDVDASPAAGKAAEGPAGRHKPGKLPPRSKEPSQDSGQAAADVLRNLSRRK